RAAVIHHDDPLDQITGERRYHFPDGLFLIAGRDHRRHAKRVGRTGFLHMFYLLWGLLDFGGEISGQDDCPCRVQTSAAVKRLGGEPAQRTWARAQAGQWMGRQSGGWTTRKRTLAGCKLRRPPIARSKAR